MLNRVQVEEDHLGQGVDRALVEKGLGYYGGMHQIYVHRASPEDAPLYEEYEFVKIGESKSPEDGTVHYRMLREPDAQRAR